MNRFSSLFSQILKFIPRTDFVGEVRKLSAERHARGVSCWQQLVSMLFCQLGRAHGLREIEKGLRSCEGKLSHLGINVVGRSSFSYMSAHRPWQPYRDVFHLLYGRNMCQLPHSQGRKMKRFRFKNKLVSLDASVLVLCLSMSNWAKFPTTKGAIKLHLLLDHDGYLPSLAVITTDSVHDVTVAKTRKFQPGTISMDERGYNDYELLGGGTDERVYFVTRMKDNALYRVVKNQPVPCASNSNIKKVQVIRFPGPQAKKMCSLELRVVTFYDEEQKREFLLLSNNFRLAATTIAAFYEDRWAVELSFQTLKQNLKIKTFVGTTPTALKTQVWSAFITMLLLCFMHLKLRWGWSMSNLVELMRINLCTHREFWARLDSPFALRPESAGACAGGTAFWLGQHRGAGIRTESKVCQKFQKKMVDASPDSGQIGQQ